MKIKAKNTNNNQDSLYKMIKRAIYHNDLEILCTEPTK